LGLLRRSLASSTTKKAAQRAEKLVLG
jgi:hypothetical protein